MRRVVLDEQAVTVGRYSSNRLVLADPFISRRHCIIETKDKTARVRDLGSRLGIKVNRKRLIESELSDGDRISIGPYELVYIVEPDGAANGSSASVTIEPAPPSNGHGAEARVVEPAQIATDKVEAAPSPEPAENGSGDGEEKRVLEVRMRRMRDEHESTIERLSNSESRPRAACETQREAEAERRTLATTEPSTPDAQVLAPPTANGHGATLPGVAESRQVMGEIFSGAPRYADDRDYGKWLLAAAVVLLVVTLVLLFVRSMV